MLFLLQPVFYIDTKNSNELHLIRFIYWINQDDLLSIIFLLMERYPVGKEESIKDKII